MATDGKVFGQDPFHLALFLAPIAELLKAGAGTSLFTGALHGLTQRDVLAQRRKEQAESKAERDAERRADVRRDYIRIGIQHPESIPFLKNLPEVSDLEWPDLPPKPTGKVRVKSPSGMELDVSPEAALAHERAQLPSPAEQRHVTESGQKTAQAQFTATRDQLVRKIHERVGAGDMAGARSAAAALDDLANRAPGIGTSGEAELLKAQRVGKQRGEKAETEELRQRRLTGLIERGGRRGGGGRPDKSQERRISQLQARIDTVNSQYRAAKARAEANPTDANKASVAAAFAKGETLGRQLNRELARRGTSPAQNRPTQQQPKKSNLDQFYR